MGIPLTQAMEKEFLRMSWALAMVSGRSQFIVLQSQNLQDEARKGAKVEGLTNNLMHPRGLGNERSALTADTGHKAESGRGGILITGGVRLAFWFL